MKRIQKIRRASKWMRLHIVLTAIVFSFYFVASFLYSPHFFVSDIEDKFHVSADTVVVTAQVLDAPAKPAVSANVSCISGNPSITLDWEDDDNSYAYDVLRDGNTIVSGLTLSFYQDIMISGADYTYTVIAYGPMGPGFAASDPVSANAITACFSTSPSVRSRSDTGSSSHESKKTPNTRQSPPGIEVHAPVITDNTPFDFRLRIIGSEATFIQGDTIESEITIERIDPTHASDPATIRYSVVDADGAVVSVIDVPLDHVSKGKAIRQSIALPADMKHGDYVLYANMTVGAFHRIRSATFSVTELPLVTLQSGVVITYPQAVRYIGWIAFILLALLLVWFLLWIREYWLYAHATRHIAEKHLSGKGLIAKRKEVSS